MDHVDRAALKDDMDKLRKELESSQGEEDLHHLNYIVSISNLFTVVGIASLWLPCHFIFPWVFLSTGTFARWTMIAHHTCHGGYDHTSDSRYNRFKFGLGSFQRRFNDWLDWMLPEAWNVEHNNLHHYNLGEVTDPDLVEHNLKEVRESQSPMFFKYLRVLGAAATWKWLYYAPNTFKFYYMNKIDRSELKRKDAYEPFLLHEVISDLLNGDVKPWMNGLFYVLTPYFTFTFVLLPLAWGFISWTVTGHGYETLQNALINVVIAEVMTNLHSFLMIVTNHAGNDLYRFESSCTPRSGEFYLRQIISSVNFSAGSDMIDYPHGWLNYQIEHHLFPSLSMLSYRRAMPRVKEICKKHQIPYIQQNVFIRLWKTVQIMVGSTSMLKYKEVVKAA